jgi:hypothetical protein
MGNELFGRFTTLRAHRTSYSRSRYALSSYHAPNQRNVYYPRPKKGIKTGSFLLRLPDDNAKEDGYFSRPTLVTILVHDAWRTNQTLLVLLFDYFNYSCQLCCPCLMMTRINVMSSQKQKIRSRLIYPSYGGFPLLIHTLQ